MEVTWFGTNSSQTRNNVTNSINLILLILKNATSVMKRDIVGEFSLNILVSTHRLLYKY